MKSNIKPNKIIFYVLVVTVSILVLISSVVYFKNKGRVWTIKDADINSFAQINELSDIIADELDIQKKDLELIDMSVNVSSDSIILKLIIDFAVKTEDKENKFEHYQIQKNDENAKLTISHRGKTEDIASYINLVDGLNLFSQIPIESGFERYNLTYSSSIHQNIQPNNSFNSFVFDGQQYISLASERSGCFMHIAKTPYNMGESDPIATAIFYYQINI